MPFLNILKQPNGNRTKLLASLKSSSAKHGKSDDNRSFPINFVVNAVLREKWERFE